MWIGWRGAWPILTRRGRRDRRLGILMGLYGSMEGGLRRFLLRLRSRYRRVVRLLMLASGNSRVWQRLLIRARRKRVWREVAVHVDVDSILRSILHVCREVRERQRRQTQGRSLTLGIHGRSVGWPPPVGARYGQRCLCLVDGGCDAVCCLECVEDARRLRFAVPAEKTPPKLIKPRLASAAALQHCSIHFILDSYAFEE